MENITFPFLITTSDTSETETAGAAVAELLLNDRQSLPRFVALYGDLGAGKTAFVRGLASVLASGVRVKSPTFAIVHEYPGKLPVFHFDMYRITSDDELYSTGFYDYFSRSGVIVTEWSENIEYALPGEYIKITIIKPDPKESASRRISGEIIKDGIPL